jgi:hypothetical protein
VARLPTVLRCWLWSHGNLAGPSELAEDWSSPALLNCSGVLDCFMDANALTREEREMFIGKEWSWNTQWRLPARDCVEIMSGLVLDKSLTSTEKFVYRLAT